MEIRYTLTTDDLRHFNRYWMLHRPSTVLPLVLAAPGLVLLLSAFFHAVAGSPRVTIAWWWILATLALTLFLVCWGDFALASAARQTPGGLGEFWLRITPTGVEERTALTDQLTMWPRIRSVVSTRRAIYLFTSDHQGYLAPRRAFTSEAEAEVFLSLARSYWQAARDQTIAPPPGGPSALTRGDAA